MGKNLEGPAGKGRWQYLNYYRPSKKNKVDIAVNSTELKRDNLPLILR